MIALSTDTAPIFVVGCPRSGTTLLYHMLISSGAFANYPDETKLYCLFLPRFGDPRNVQNRRKLIDFWLQSKWFQKTGLEPSAIRPRLMSECRSGGDFLRIVMGSIATAQDVPGWAECTPDHIFYLHQIKAEIPQSRFLHIIRDGRDVSLSYLKAGWIYPLPWDRKIPLLVAGWVWEWIVRLGRKNGNTLGSAYREVHFEDLVNHPAETLASLEEFVGARLDYEQIRKSAVGSVSIPNTAFQVGSSPGSFDPVGRWKTKFDLDELGVFEALVGNTLREFGYDLKNEGDQTGPSPLYLRKNAFQAYRGLKQWVKDHTPLARFLVDTDLAE